MSSLAPFLGKPVLLETTSGEFFVGTVEDYIFSEDNENHQESIIIKTGNGELLELNAEDLFVAILWSSLGRMPFESLKILSQKVT